MGFLKLFCKHIVQSLSMLVDEFEVMNDGRRFGFAQSHGLWLHASGDEFLKIIIDVANPL